MPAPSRPSFRLMLPLPDGYLWVDPAEIIWAEAEEEGVRVMVAPGTCWRVQTQLAQLEAWLPLRVFYRVHSRCLVNRLRMRRLIRGGGGYLVMEDGKKVPLSAGQGPGPALASGMDLIG